MRLAALVAWALGSVAGTLALLLFEPRTDLGIGAALVLATAIVPFARIDLTPWAIGPPLAALALWSTSAPGGYFPAIVAAVVCATLYGAVMLIRLTWRRLAPSTRSSRRTWLASLALGVVVAFATASTMPLELRFRLSEDAMSDVARDVLAGRRDPSRIERIGFWKVDDVNREPGGVRFLVVGTGVFDRHGFAYVTNGLPPPGARYVGGGWYSWTSDFEL